MPYFNLMKSWYCLPHRNKRCILIQPWIGLWNWNSLWIGIHFVYTTSWKGLKHACPMHPHEASAPSLMASPSIARRVWGVSQRETDQKSMHRGELTQMTLFPTLLVHTHVHVHNNSHWTKLGQKHDCCSWGPEKANDSSGGVLPHTHSHAEAYTYAPHIICTPTVTHWLHSSPHEEPDNRKSINYHFW